ncbi:hypothetical protein [Thalassospira tepidiphila]|uniref:Uncharacterized protein n=1 Tax=Thalassospira tepidiphila TaxID=393657 RepID=A0ABX0WZI9_9PROT|nr:hypothetical protein [Thalassospira tepidiphila]NJB74713.1 hypothetical protein [Thalassospira tepidiphila]
MDSAKRPESQENCGVEQFQAFPKNADLITVAARDGQAADAALKFAFDPALRRISSRI